MKYPWSEMCLIFTVIILQWITVEKIMCHENDSDWTHYALAYSKGPNASIKPLHHGQQQSLIWLFETVVHLNKSHGQFTNSLRNSKCMYILDAFDMCKTQAYFIGRPNRFN